MQSRSWFLWRLTNVPRSRQTDTSPANRASPAHVIRPPLACFLAGEILAQRLKSDTVYRIRDWLLSPANFKGAKIDAKIYVERSTTPHNILFCARTLCMNYVTSTFLVTSFSVRSKQLLCFVHGQGQKREQKPTTKNFVGFHNSSPLFTMLWRHSPVTGSRLSDKKGVPTQARAVPLGARLASIAEFFFVLTGYGVLILDILDQDFH